MILLWISQRDAHLLVQKGEDLDAKRKIVEIIRTEEIKEKLKSNPVQVPLPTDGKMQKSITISQDRSVSFNRL